MKNRDIQELFDGTVKKLQCHDFRTVFKDMCRMGALSIANSIRTPKWHERENEYLQIVRKYNEEELNLIVELYFNIVFEIAGSKYEDFLGDLYTKSEIGNKRLAQYFTPPQVSEVMARINLQGISKLIEENGFVSINDPCSGAGGLLLSAAKIILEQGHDPYYTACFVAQDIDRTCADMATIQLFYNDIPAAIQCGDTITYVFHDTIYTPQWFTSGLGERFCAEQRKEDKNDE